MILYGAAMLSKAFVELAFGPPNFPASRGSFAGKEPLLAGTSPEYCFFFLHVFYSEKGKLSFQIYNLKCQGYFVLLYSSKESIFSLVIL